MMALSRKAVIILCCKAVRILPQALIQGLNISVTGELLSTWRGFYVLIWHMIKGCVRTLYMIEDYGSSQDE